MAFKHEHFDVPARQVFHQNRRARDRSCDCRSVNLCAPQPFRHLEEHRALLERHVAGAGLEAEECLGANARESVILKEKLGARLHAGLQPEIIPDDLAEHGRACAILRINHTDLVDDLGDFRLRQRPSGEPRQRPAKRGERQGKKICFREWHHRGITA